MKRTHKILIAAAVMVVLGMTLIFSGKVMGADSDIAIGDNLYLSIGSGHGITLKNSRSTNSGSTLTVTEETTAETDTAAATEAAVSENNTSTDEADAETVDSGTESGNSANASANGGVSDDKGSLKGTVTGGTGEETTEESGIDSFTSIDVELVTGRLEIVNGEAYSVEYHTKDTGFSCEVQYGTLKIKSSQSYKRSYSADNSGDYVVITVPAGVLQEVDVDLTYGDAYISGIACDKLDVECEGGNITVKDAAAAQVELDASMASVEFLGTCTEKLSVEVSKGAALVEGYLACDMEIEASMGDISVVSYYCSDAYQWEVDTRFGSYEINDQGGAALSGSYKIELKSSMGNVTLSFVDA